MSGEADKPTGSAAESIFTAALELSPSERPAYLAQTCGQDQRLRRRVEALLCAHEAPAGFLPEEPEARTRGGSFPTNVVAASLTEQPGDMIGPYMLLQKVGEGGCGIVYMAEQKQPVRRRVALKVIKLGMDTKQVVARFEAERQALAMMDHPNIAKVFDAGATEVPLTPALSPSDGERVAKAGATEALLNSTLSPSDGERVPKASEGNHVLSAGRPYFVMELVSGLKITDYCDQHQLTTSQRLGLFIQVCRAIQHAHQKGVIHRDIKPSNVLVATQDPDSSGVPKVIDFGIAKATQGRLTDQTVFTALEQFIGTPAYMSPEQAELGGLDVDTRSDIYSLGVLVYELLTGKTPFDTQEMLAGGLDEIRRTIREKEPARPSTRLSTMAVGELKRAAECRRSDAPRLIHVVRGDLDWIVMKCLEKERARRYETANGLATDIERYLKNEPVSARPPSGLYRFQKLVRRNRVVAISAVAIALVLILGVVASMWQARKANKEAVRSQQVAKFLTDMLQSVGPSTARGQDTKMMRGILDQTAQRVTRDLHDQPDVEAELVGIVGGVYKELGDDEEAERMFLKALAIRGKGGDATMADLLAQLCYTQWRQSEKRPQAETNGRQAIAIYRKLEAWRPGIGNPKMAYALDQLAHSLRFQGRQKEAEAAAREALTVVGPKPTPARAYALQVLAMVVLRTEPPLAESLLREAVNIPRASEEIENVWRLEILSIAISAQGRVEEAEEVLRQGIGSARQSNDLDALVHSLLTLGKLLRQKGDLEAATSTFREDVEMMRTTFGTGYRLYGAVVVELADNLRLQGKPAEAATFYRQALALPIQEHRSGVNRSVCLQRLVEVLKESGDSAAVDQLVDELKSASITNSMTSLPSIRRRQTE